MTTFTAPKHPDVNLMLSTLERSIPSHIQGSVWSVGRNAIEAVCLPAPVGATCRIHLKSQIKLPAEVIGFSGSMTLLAPLDGSDGIAPGDKVELLDTVATIPVGDELLGRVIDAAGHPLDDLGPIATHTRAPVDADPVG